jgi:hypothetical protein
MTRRNERVCYDPPQGLAAELRQELQDTRDQADGTPLCLALVRGRAQSWGPIGQEASSEMMDEIRRDAVELSLHECTSTDALELPQRRAHACYRALYRLYSCVVEVQEGAATADGNGSADCHENRPAISVDKPAGSEMLISGPAGTFYHTGWVNITTVRTPDGAVAWAGMLRSPGNRALVIASDSRLRTTESRIGLLGLTSMIDRAVERHRFVIGLETDCPNLHATLNKLMRRDFIMPDEPNRKLLEHLGRQLSALTVWLAPLRSRSPFTSELLDTVCSGRSEESSETEKEIREEAPF